MRRAAITVGLVAALLLPTVGSGAADAATINWARPCKSTHTVHVTTRCVVTEALGGHRIRYHDAAGMTHTIHRGSSAWTWLRRHSKPCKSMASTRCYGHDDLTGSRVFVNANGLHIVLKSLR